MAGRSDDSTAGVAGYVAVGLGDGQASAGLSAAGATWLLFALAFVIAVHFRLGFAVSR